MDHSWNVEVMWDFVRLAVHTVTEHTTVAKKKKIEFKCFLAFYYFKAYKCAILHMQ